MGKEAGDCEDERSTARTKGQDRMPQRNKGKIVGRQCVSSRSNILWVEKIRPNKECQHLTADLPSSHF